MARKPELLVLGHVTCDEFGDEARLGGAAGYAARAAATLGLDTALVTVAPPGSPMLAPLAETPGLSLHVSPSDVMTTFAVDYRGPRRRLVLRATARPLTLADVPQAWRSPRLVYAGTVFGECDRALLDAFSGAHVMAAVQGWLRRRAPDGAIEPALSPEALDPPASLRSVVLSEEDHPSAEEVAARFGARGIFVALTRGRRGATILHRERRIEIPAAPAEEVDPTGAGDVFGLVFGLALAKGLDAAEAGRRAARAAARVVEGPGLGRLAESKEAVV
jgi:1D-myo-inositol 3-kinase